MIKALALIICAALAAAVSWGVGNISIDSPRADVPFESDISSPGLVVHSIRVSTNDAMTSFFIDYESDMTRGFLLFDPPDGKSVRIQGADSLPSGRHEARIEVESVRLAHVERLSIWILGGAADSVSFQMKDISAVSAGTDSDSAGPPEEPAGSPGVPAGPRSRLQASDALALAGSGVTLAAFTLLPGANGDLSTREYVRNGVSGSDAMRMESAAVGAIDSIHDRMPSLKALVKEQGLPSRIVMNDDVGTRTYTVFYGSVQLYFIDSVDHLEQIRLQATEPPYRLGQKIGVGSSLDEAFAMLGQPASRAADTRVDFADRVLYSVTRGGSTEQSIGYAAQGVRLFFKDGVVTAVYLVAPGAHQPGNGQSSAGNSPNGSEGTSPDSNKEGADSWGPDDIFAIP
jgi:hypothetical protein